MWKKLIASHFGALLVSCILTVVVMKGCMKDPHVVAVEKLTEEIAKKAQEEEKSRQELSPSQEIILQNATKNATSTINSIIDGVRSDFKQKEMSVESRENTLKQDQDRLNREKASLEKEREILNQNKEILRKEVEKEVKKVEVDKESTLHKMKLDGERKISKKKTELTKLGVSPAKSQEREEKYTEIVRDEQELKSELKKVEGEFKERIALFKSLTK